MNELPGESLLITGGENINGIVFKNVVRIDTLRELAVTHRPPMPTKRYWHCAVYHDGLLYTLGGHRSRNEIVECERYVCAEQRWETLPPLPRASYAMSGVVHEGSLYVLGGYSGQKSDVILRLSLDRLTWEVMQVKLPEPALCITCFKRNDRVYFVVDKTLHSLQPFRPVKTLPEPISSNYGPSYYSRGTLYCSNAQGAARKLKIAA
jgi:hypothetical protein